MITRVDLDRCTVVQSAHNNMGRKGYGYGYRFVEIPRLDWLRALQDKGMVEYGRKPWPDDYKPEMKIEHLRWSPTIRRRDQDGGA